MNKLMPGMTSQCQGINELAPQTWDDYEEACCLTYAGGHHEPETLAVFRHGMRTVFRLLSEEFPDAGVCKQASQLARDREKLRRVCDEVGSFLSEPGTMPELASQRWHTKLILDVREVLEATATKPATEKDGGG